jgi:hypothetical protein
VCEAVLQHACGAAHLRSSTYGLPVSTAGSGAQKNSALLLVSASRSSQQVRIPGCAAVWATCTDITQRQGTQWHVAAIAILMRGRASTQAPVGTHQPVCQLRVRQFKGLDGAVTACVPRGGFKGAQHSAGAGRGPCSAPTQLQCWVVSTKQAVNVSVRRTGPARHYNSQDISK